MTGTNSSKISFFHSVFMRSTLIVFICTLCVTGMLTLLNFSSSKEAAFATAHERLTRATSDLTGLIISPLRFSAPDRGAQVLAEMMTNLSGESTGAIVLDKTGEEFAASVSEIGASRLMSLAQTAYKEIEAQTDMATLSYAMPALSNDGTLLGVVAMEWSSDLATAALKASLIKALSITAAVFVVALAGAAWVFSGSIGAPLRRVAQAVQAVQNEDFSVEIRGRRRKDEIGMIARAIEELRDSLKASAAINRQAKVNSTALDASTSAVILTGNDHRITYVNEAASQLLRKHEAALRTLHSAFSADNLIGYRADEILSAGPRAAGSLDAGSSDTIRIGQQLESGYLSVMINPVYDESGQKIGHVSEWRDLTDEQRNAAVIDAIHRNQLRIDLTPDARIDLLNAACATLLGASPEALFGVSMAGKILHEGTPVCQLMSNLQPIVGRFILLLGGREVQLEGSANPILNDEGELTHFCLLANDVSAQQAALDKLDIERKTMEDAQRNVVEALRAALEKLSNGDLASPIDREFPQSYETLRIDYNTATTNLLFAIKQVLDNANSIRNEAGQIAAAADDMSRRTEQQAATLEQTAAAMNQLTAAVQSAADGADRANKMVADAKSHAETSGNIVREAVTAMGEIEDSSNKISKITSVIDEIAFQTNLLALNAGVEAARAGEAGRGFAVVASEVRALAQRSSDAAREIAGLISSSSNQVKRGVDLVGQAGDALGSIQISVTDIFSVVSDIAVSTREQSTGLNEINSAVHQLDQVTQQNAAMFEQSTAASQSLNREANILISTMEQFSLGNEAPDGVGTASFRSQREPAFAAATSAPPAQPVAPAAKRLSSLAVKPDPAEDEWEDF